MLFWTSELWRPHLLQILGQTRRTAKKNHLLKAQLPTLLVEKGKEQQVIWQCVWEITVRCASSYSVTALFRNSEVWTPHFNRRFVQVQIVCIFPLTVINYNPWNADTLLFHEAGRFYTCMSFMQDCLPLLLGSTTWHHNSISTHSAGLCLAFLTNM